MAGASSYSPKSSASSGRRGSAIIIQAALKRNSKKKKSDRDLKADQSKRRGSALLIQGLLQENLEKKKKSKRETENKKVDKKRRDSAVLIAEFVKKNSGKSLLKKEASKRSTKKGTKVAIGGSKATSPSSRAQSKRDATQITSRRNESNRRGSAMLIQQAWKNKKSASGRSITSIVAKARKKKPHITQPGMKVRHAISGRNLPPPQGGGCMGGEGHGPSRILKNLYLGNREDAMDLVVLQSLGIKYIVNATEQLDNFHEGALSYIKVNVKDKEGVDLSPYFDQVTDFIGNALESDSGVLVHCIAGASRSVAFTLAYMMSPRGEKLSLKDSFNFVKARRSCAHPNQSFLLQLAQYEQTLHGGASSIARAKEKIWNNYELNSLKKGVKEHLQTGKLKISSGGCSIM